MKLKVLYPAIMFISSVCLTFVVPDVRASQTELPYVISGYRQALASHPLDYSLLEKKSLPGVRLQRYQLTSQNWSPQGVVSPEKWQHEVDVYIPDAAREKHALVVINNGINDDGSGRAVAPGNFDQQTLTRIASSTQTIVVSVSNIPNQQLTYQGNTGPLLEDYSMAYSWKLFMDDQQKYATLPLYVPMSAAVSQTFRLAQQELRYWKIDKFIVTGASKRGWAAWLTALSDPSVDAIVPFAIDLLNIKQSLKHMYLTYGRNWPVAFYPYYKHEIDKQIDSEAFAQLMVLEDPLSYLNTPFSSRFTIEKYMINASGDDFYTADSSRFYYDKLPGSRSLRMVANVTHNGILSVAEQSLIPFVNRFQTQQKLPQINATLQGTGNKQMLAIRFSEPPASIVQWTAHNPLARDFRYACGVKYTASALALPAAGAKVNVVLTTAKSGWQATYIEATFNDGYVATTRVYITPDDKYPETAPPAKGRVCRTLPGRTEINSAS